MQARCVRLLLGLLMVLMSVGCQDRAPTAWPRSGSGAGEQTPIPTQIVPTSPIYAVKRGSILRQLQFTGRVAPQAEDQLFFRSAGRVRTVFVEQGELVKKGQLLADLEAEPLERQLAAAELDLERAQARLDVAEIARQAAVARAEANLRIANLNLEIEQAHTPGPRKVQAEADLQIARLALQKAQGAYDAIAWRNDRASTAEAVNLEGATLVYQKAQAAFDLALQEIAVYGRKVALQEQGVVLAQLALDELQRGVDPLLQNDVRRATLSVDNLRAQIADMQVTAPFDGQVQSLSLIAGRPVDAFAPVISVADPALLDVRADLPASDVSLLSEGMPATIVLTSRPSQPLAGRVRRLPIGTQEAGADGQDRSTRVALDQPTDVTLVLGDTARVTVALEQHDDVLWLPPQAVRTFDSRRFVIVQEGSVQRRVDVKVGLETEERLEILEGLVEGQTVIGR